VPMNFIFNNTNFDLEDFGNEIVIINISIGSYYTISGSAVTVFRWFFSPVAIDQINLLIQETYPNEVSEASTFVEWLKQQGLIQAIEVTQDNKDLGHPEKISNTVIFNEWTYSRFDDMADLIRLDPIHDVSDKGWPHRKSND
jgi:hypothetical protein